MKIHRRAILFVAMAVFVAPGAWPPTGIVTGSRARRGGRDAGHSTRSGSVRTSSSWPTTCWKPRHRHEGGDLAANYIATQFAHDGLQPAGDDGGYLQRVGFTGCSRNPPRRWPSCRRTAPASSWRWARTT